MSKRDICGLLKLGENAVQLDDNLVNILVRALISYDRHQRTRIAAVLEHDSPHADRRALNARRAAELLSWFADCGWRMPKDYAPRERCPVFPSRLFQGGDE